MNLLTTSAWPTWLAFLILAVAAVINLRTKTVPNWLSLGGIMLAWLVASLAKFTEVEGTFVASFAATFVGFAVLYLWMASGALGQGCVKAQMAFGAWLGCSFGLEKAATIAFVAGLAGSILLGIVCIAINFRRKSTLLPNQMALSSIAAQMPLSVGSIIGTIAYLSLA